MKHVPLDEALPRIRGEWIINESLTCLIAGVKGINRSDKRSCYKRKRVMTVTFLRENG